MITDRVIKEIYKKYGKAAKNVDDLRLDYFIGLLAPNHNIVVDGNEIILADQEEFNPFRRFLIRGLHAVIEFDRQVAFVFKNHILFLGKDSGEMRVHMSPVSERRNIFKRLFAY